MQDVEGRKLINPFFSLPAQDGEGSVTARAEWAELRSNPGSGKLTLELYNSTVEAPGHYAALPDEKFVYEVEIVPQKGFGDSGPAHLALWQFPEATARQKELIEEHEQQMVAQSGFQMLTGDFDGLAGGGWNDGAHHLQHLKWQLYRMQTEPPRRWANGFSCLCFALVGATMAIRLRNSDVLTSFFLCFGPILLVYYPLLIFGHGSGQGRRDQSLLRVAGQCRPGRVGLVAAAARDSLLERQLRTHGSTTCDPLPAAVG